MAVDFSNTLIVAISATALFDLAENEAKLAEYIQEDKLTAARRFHDYQQARENEILQKGSGYPLIEALLNLNKFQSNQDYEVESPFVEVVIISKSSPDMGIQVLNSIRAYELGITRSAFISGDSVANYIKDFNVDLFLTTNREDAQVVVDARVCACAVLDTTPVKVQDLDSDQLRIAFDGDAVLFDDAGELVFKQEGLQAFHHHEVSKADLPIDKGPYADFLIKLSQLQAKLPNQSTDAPHNPIRIALVTARNAPADMRAIKTLREWGVTVDVAFFLGGLDKTGVLKTFAPHIFFDDSIKHIDAARSVVPSALVPYHSESQLNILAPQAVPDMEDQAFTPVKKSKAKA
ncbi:5'-nucleotidase [Moraxella sp. FZLJ2107]|uniref:5'-nucleotidase n=1 Tax=unclassified Moraxella TaxID=2685852 RepID=UPI0020C8423B|nr:MULTISPECIES: 5'-nucleotidase [unclassified Moraxella]UTO04893.1 5'-nucleotidase [Moraxella sp. FZLJ2107]UTO21627.1 5'-nucleotidase [Moraxella sp. FZLJ2109]